jgi:hypothetical protein
VGHALKEPYSQNVHQETPSLVWRLFWKRLFLKHLFSSFQNICVPQNWHFIQEGQILQSKMLGSGNICVQNSLWTQDCWLSLRIWVCVPIVLYCIVLYCIFNSFLWTLVWNILLRFAKWMVIICGLYSRDLRLQY